MTVSEVKFFLSHLRKGKADDLSYRKALINIFVNAIFVYDDKITIIFNTGDKPITINDELLSDIEENNAAIEGSILDTVAPPNKTDHFDTKSI